MEGADVYDFAADLKVDPDGIVEGTEKEFPDGTVAAVVPLTFDRGRIVTWDKENPESLTNGWCYDDPHVAVEELKKWDGTGEPDGWMRQPMTGRRRPGGDASKEYVHP